MKKIVLYMTLGFLGLVSLSGCSEKDEYPAPTPLDANAITYEARPGAIKLKWAIPDNANYKYIKVQYKLPDSEKEYLQLASVYSDTLLVDNLLKRYGEIEFKLQPCTPDGKGGEVYTIKAQAESAPVTVKSYQIPSPLTKISIAGDKLWTDAQELSEGPIADLVDDDDSSSGSFFHMTWDGPTEFPHYIVMDLGEPMQAITFSYVCRNHANKDNPKSMDILVSNEFGLDTNEGDYPAAEKKLAVKVGSVSSDLPDTQGASYMAKKAYGRSSRESFRYVWFKVLSSTSGSSFIALSDMKIYKAKKIVYNPETGEQETLE